MAMDERYRKSVERVRGATGADEEHAYVMLLLTSALMDLCPWDSETAEIVISDCKGKRHVDLREPEPCKG